MPTQNAFALALRRRWWLVLLVLGGALATSAVLTSREVPQFRASATSAVIPNSSIEGAAEVMRSLETLERRSVIATLARIPSSPEARASAAERLKLEETALRGFRVSATVVPNTNLIKVDVEGPDAKLASDLANALSAVTRRETRSLYRIFTLRQMIAATPAAAPFHPDPQRNQVVAAILGLLLGVLAAFAADRLLSAPRA